MRAARALLRAGRVIVWLAVVLALANAVGAWAGHLPWWLIGLPAPITLAGLAVCLVGVLVGRRRAER